MFMVNYVSILVCKLKQHAQQSIKAPLLLQAFVYFLHHVFLLASFFLEGSVPKQAAYISCICLYFTVKPDKPPGLYFLHFSVLIYIRRRRKNRNQVLSPASSQIRSGDAVKWNAAV